MTTLITNTIIDETAWLAADAEVSKCKNQRILILRLQQTSLRATPETLFFTNITGYQQDITLQNADGEAAGKLFLW